MINTQYAPKTSISSQKFPKAQNLEPPELGLQNIDEFVPSLPNLQAPKRPQWAQNSKAKDVLKWGAASGLLLGAGVGIAMSGYVYTGAMTLGMSLACLTGAAKSAFS